MGSSEVWLGLISGSVGSGTSMPGTQGTVLAGDTAHRGQRKVIAGQCGILESLRLFMPQFLSPPSPPSLGVSLCLCRGRQTQRCLGGPSLLSRSVSASANAMNQHGLLSLFFTCDGPAVHCQCPKIRTYQISRRKSLLHLDTRRPARGCL